VYRAQAWIDLASAVTSGASAESRYHLRARPGRHRATCRALLVRRWDGLAAATFNDSEPEATLDLAGIRVTSRDRRADRYLASRFDSQFPLELKMLILMIEGDLNTARLILPRTARGHLGAEFRARTLTAYHCLSALKRISDQHSGLSTSGLDGLRALLADAAAQRLLSLAGEKGQEQERPL
jgi:hypothetical protein